mmetsp:Transcript_54746/g.163697  ORF Transcript_54746/g.163697 Transcript_54746/m.163697 type:complete len:201 (-) Transcript_54746:1188-1790(-)
MGESDPSAVAAAAAAVVVVALVRRLLGIVPAVRRRIALNHPLGIPARGVRPILESAPYVIDEIVHRARPVRRGGGGPSAAVPGEAGGDLGLGLVVRGGIAQMARISPLVCHNLHPPVKRQTQLKHMIPEQFVDRTPRDRSHALGGIRLIVREITIRIDAVLLSAVEFVPQRVRRGYDDDATGRGESSEPLTVRGRYAPSG